MANQLKFGVGPTNDQYISIQQFYTGKNIFITGATGFVGKILVEKLLRSCPKIGHIYLMVRSKNEASTSERLRKIIDSKVFDKMKETRPKDLDKIRLICGNLTSDELGISPEDREVLLKTVSVVFHSAATIRFDEPLKTAIAINMNGTRKIIELCQQMEGLEALVYVSTAYSNCDRFDIDEKFYRQPCSAASIEAMAGCFPEEIINKLTLAVIHKKPNTYTLTKALAEEIISTEANQLPVAIVRPSIVGASYQEPVPGWLDNFGGPAGPVCAIGSGVMRTVRLDTDTVADIVPVDFVINVAIAAGWNTAIGSATKDNISIYNCVTGNQNPITWNNFSKAVVSSMRKNPLEKVFWYIGLTTCNSDWLYEWLTYLYQHVPAMLMDLYTRCVGKKPIMTKIQKRIQKNVGQLQFFMTNQWSFNDGNVRRLLNEMSAEDRSVFEIDTTVIRWNEYVENYCLGMRKYLLKQKEDTLPGCRKNMFRLRWYHQIFKVLFVVIFLCLLLTLANLL